MGCQPPPCDIQYFNPVHPRCHIHPDICGWFISTYMISLTSPEWLIYPCKTDRPLCICMYVFPHPRAESTNVFNMFPPTSWFPFPNVQHPFAPFLHIFLLSNLKTSSSSLVPVVLVLSITTILNTSYMGLLCSPFNGLTGRRVQICLAVSGDVLCIIFLCAFSFVSL